MGASALIWTVSVSSLVMLLIVLVKMTQTMKRYGVRNSICVVRQLASAFNATVDLEVRQMTNEKLRAARAKCARMGLPIFCFMGVGWSCTLSVSAILQDPETRDPRTEATLILMVCPAVLFMFLYCFPQLVATDRGRRLSYFASMCLIAWSLIMEVSAELEARKTTIAVVASLLMNALDFRMWSLLPPNICLFALIFITHLRKFESFETFLVLLSFDAMFLFAGVLVYVALEKLLILCTRQEVEVTMSRCHQSAVTSLLDMMCDTVVELGEHACLKQHDPRLAVMLMCGPGRTLQGEKLESFMFDDDSRTRFAASLERCGASRSEEHRSEEHTSDTKASMLNVCFRDSSGSKIRAVTYNIPYRVLSGSIHYLIGIREENEFNIDERDWGHGDEKPLTDRRPAGMLRPEMADKLQELASTKNDANRPPPSLSQGSRGSSRGSNQGSVRSAAVEAFELARSLEVYLLDGLPIKSSRMDLQAELGLEEQCEGHVLPKGFGQLLSSNGASILLQRLRKLVESRPNGRPKGPLMRHLGDWEITASSGAPLSSKRLSLAVSFHVPAHRSADGVPYVTIAVGKDKSGGVPLESLRGRGPATGSDPQNLPQKRNSTGPVMTL